MIKKIDIMGVQLDNYTVREAIRQVETYLESGVLNTIESISMQMLMDSEQDTVQRQVITSLDLAIIGEKEIMQAAGIGTMQRMNETEENDFFFEFFKRMERNKKNLFLLGENEQAIEELKDMLQTEYPKLVIVGEYALENCVGDQDAVINDMNALTPDVIVSVLPSPMQEHFFWEHKDKMNASIWYGVGKHGMGRKRHSVSEFFKNTMRRVKLRSSIEKYQEDGDQKEAQ